MARIGIALLLLVLAPGAPARQITISADSLEHPALSAPVTALQLRCRLTVSAGAATCADGQLSARTGQARLDAAFDARAEHGGRWQVQGQARARDLTLSDAAGRRASERLDLDLRGQLASHGDGIEAELQAALLRGQAYVEPVFVDFGTAPATVSARLRLDDESRTITVDRVAVDQPGVLRASGKIRAAPGAAALVEARIEALQLAPAFANYLQPFLAGTGLEQLALSGQARGRLVFEGAQPRELALQLDAVGLESPANASGLRDVTGTLNWRANGAADDAVAESSLRWSGGHLAGLDLGAAQLRFRTMARDLQLLAPLRLPLAGGALNVRELAVQRAGQPDMAARFDAQIEPLDLAALCRAFGWPEFGGQLGGHLPGLSLQDRELRLDGALTARAFDGEIAIDGLRVLDPFGRVPRVEADIRLRNLDLAALTGAFSFGRIEGRLDGDVQDLRLLGWEPIAFRARLATPPDDRSRKRISQRAIDTISAVGGGPTGLLSRGVMRFFDDFAYARIGWSCVLADGVCQMDGIGPARDGGYVLVQGRWLPRIDVIGYQRSVDWRTFVAQLKSARDTRGVEVR